MIASWTPYSQPHHSRAISVLAKAFGRASGLCLFASSLFAQSGNQADRFWNLYSETPFTLESFSHAIPSSTGELWTLSDRRFVRSFDGRVWKDHAVNTGEFLKINDLAIMQDGNPWIATESGVHYFDGSSFEQVSLPFPTAGIRFEDITAFPDGKISLIGLSEDDLPFAVCFDGDTWKQPELLITEGKIQFFYLTEHAAFLGTEESLHFRRNQGNWIELIRATDNERLESHFAEGPGVVTFTHTTDQKLTVWRSTLNGTTERLKPPIPLTVPKHQERLPATATESGNLAFLATEDERQNLYQVSADGVEAIRATLPFPHAKIQSLAESQNCFWLSGDEHLSALDLETNTPYATQNTGTAISLQTDGGLWSLSGNTLINISAPDVLFDVRDSIGSASGKPWFAMQNGSLALIDGGKLNVIDTPPTISDSTHRLQVSGNRGKTFLYSSIQNTRLFEYVDSKLVEIAIELPVSSRVHQLEHCDDQYLWLIIENSGHRFELGRWDPVLRELHTQGVPTSPTDLKIKPTIFCGKDEVILSLKGQAYRINKDLRSDFQKLTHPFDLVHQAFVYNGGKQLAIHTRKANGQNTLTLADEQNVNKTSITLGLWIPVNITPDSTLFLRKHDRSAFGRLRLGKDHTIAGVSLGALRLSEGHFFSKGREVYFTVNRPNVTSPSIAVYQKNNSPPDAAAEITTELTETGEFSHWIHVDPIRSIIDPHKTQSLKLSYRINDRDWSAYEPLDPKNRLPIYDLPYGSHHLDVRFMNEDFVESKDFQRIQYTLSNPDSPESPTNAWFLWVAALSALLSLLLTARKLMQSYGNNHALNMELRARQAAQNDLIDINQDLEKQLKRRKQELTFANEGFKNQVDERKHIESRLKQVQTELVETSRHAEVAGIATGILQNIGTMLNSLFVSLNTIEKRIETSRAHQGLEKLSELVDVHKTQPDFLTQDPKGQKVPEYLQKLANNLSEENQQNRHYIQDMAANIDQIKDIVTAQQNFAKAAGAIEQIDLKETIRQTLKLSEHSMDRQNLVVETNTEDCPSIQSERPKLQQIFLNLLQNAQWACGENSEAMGRIQVSAYSVDDAHVAVEIKDNGIGIDSEILNKIFYSGFTTRDDARGYGLHTVETLSRQLFGKIEALSDGPNQGAIFKLTLPVKPPERAPKTTPWSHTHTPPIKRSI